MRRPALALLAILMVNPAQAGFTVTAPDPDTPQHMHARGTTLFEVLANTCPRFFPVDAAYMRLRALENFKAGQVYPDFFRVYRKVHLDRAREVSEMGPEQWCRATRALMLERGLHRLFPGEKQPAPTPRPRPLERDA